MDGLKQLGAISTAHRSAIERGDTPPPLVFRSASGAETAVQGAFRPDCRLNYFIGAADERAATRSLGFGLSIDAGRLALFSDDEFLAFVLWNDLFTRMRHESNASGLSLLVSSASRPVDFMYNDATHSKIDWFVLKGLHSLGLDAAPYLSMLKKVQAFDQAAGFSLIGDKRFVHKDSGGSPQWSTEKEQRLQAWSEKLKRGDFLSVEAEMKWTNPMLSGPATSRYTEPLAAFRTLASVLQPVLGDAANDVAKKYFDNTKPPAPDHSLTPGLQRSAGVEFQMLVAHHESRRVLWLRKQSPMATVVSTACGTPSAQKCSVLALGSLAVAQPNPAWLAELAPQGLYSFEEME